MISKEVLLKTISDSNSKLKILEIIKKEPSYIRELSKKMKIFPSAVLKHLQFLEENKIVISEIVVNKKYYTLTPFGKKLLKSL